MQAQAGTGENMDFGLIEQLEKRLPGLQDTNMKELNAFEDSDLAMYPAIKIPEIKLTADQCETIANNLIRMMDRCDSALMIEVAKGIAVLAYNSLMDVDYDQCAQDSDRKPFFHKYNSRYFTEDWLRTKGQSTIDMETLMAPNPNEQDNLALKLVDLNASEFERKSSIGVWAFCHLKVFRSDSRPKLRDFLEICDPNSKKMNEIYGFQGSYRFRPLNYQVHKLLCKESYYNKPGELMYLFYRGAIILNHIYFEPEMRPQIRLLMDLVFARETALQFSGLGLVNEFRKAVHQLNISFDLLFDALEWALKDPRWLRYSPSSLKTIEILRQFYDKYERGSEKTYRYYMYARVVNHYYFYWLSSNCNQELIYALRQLCSNSRTEYNAESVYVRWGELIAAKIQGNTMYNFRSGRGSRRNQIV